MSETKFQFFTKEDLREGKCAVVTDGSEEEMELLRKLFKELFPRDIMPAANAKYYYSGQSGLWDASNETTLPIQSIREFLYGGSIDGFPPEVVGEMLRNQVLQGNKRDVRVFEKLAASSKSQGGFNWDETGKMVSWWGEIITFKNFDLLFELYPKQSSNKPIMENKTNREFSLSYDSQQKIIDSACTSWKIKLSNLWGRSIALRILIKIPESFYKEMRAACTPDQHKLFDEIFGKDQPDFPPKGTACLASDDGVCWHLNYSDGNGKFFYSGLKEGKDVYSWKHFIILNAENIKQFM